MSGLTHPARIGDRTVGSGHPAFVIAEVGQAHDGSLGTAHAYIDAIADAGADAVKFQTHIAAMESTRDEPFRVQFSKQDATRYEYWERMEFPAEAWEALAAHARERQLVFLSSAFSVPAVELLRVLGVTTWKVGSGEMGSTDLLRAMARPGDTVILSSGMSTYAEIGSSLELIRSLGAATVLLQCTSKYPIALEEVGLNVLQELRERFGCPVGYSDHSGSLWPGVAALAHGAAVIEAHVVFDKRCFGPDTDASLTLDELAQLVQARDAMDIMLRNPVDKDQMAASLEPMRKLFTKSLALVLDHDAGTVLEESMLTSKKPGTGIPPSDLHKLVGRVLRQDVSADRLLRWEDIS